MSVSNGDVLHVVIEGDLPDGTIWQNRKRFQVSAAAPISDANVLNAIKTWVETLYAYIASHIPSTTNLRDGTVDVIGWNPTAGIWEVTQNVGVYSPLDTFSGAVQELPNQCAPFVIGNTSRPRSKGRIFFPPVSENDQDGGILSAACLANMASTAAQYISDQPIGADTLISGIVREAFNQWLAFQTVAFDDLIGTQRRRRPGIGM